MLVAATSNDETGRAVQDTSFHIEAAPVRVYGWMLILRTGQANINKSASTCGRAGSRECLVSMVIDLLFYITISSMIHL